MGTLGDRPIPLFHVAAGLRAAPGGQPADQPLVREGGRREERGQDDPLHFQKLFVPTLNFKLFL